ncbi:MAG: DUF177 domain-containing protein [Deltaproteobacteria bacterium]|nr:DUF177 domain-containing protein [Deltaproteobacteria bacterium]MBW2696215.1 DUF177 domain-containing protein [Deltaproteobacteria bacterium]
MKLRVDGLTDNPVERHLSVSPAWWAERVAGSTDDSHEWVGEPGFDLRASMLGQDILLEGSFAGEMEVACSRCLKRYRQPLRESWRLVLEPVGARTPPDPEGVEMLERDGLCLADDLDVGWYRGKTLELDPFLGEVVSLALPLQPLCRENCAGLCPRCGIDRNQESCDCSETNADSPFAALAALKKKSGGSG